MGRNPMGGLPTTCERVIDSLMSENRRLALKNEELIKEKINETR